MSLSISEKNRLKNTYGAWALVTGASSGIGQELATQLAASGLNLVLVARRKTVLDQIATDLSARFGVKVNCIAADLSQKEAVETVLVEIQSVDIGLFVASAGFGTSGYFVDAKVSDELEMLAVNCTSLMLMTHHFCRRFKAQQRGGIILLSSMVSFQGTPFAAHYAATKAYVQSLAEALAVEMKPFGVDILAAAPGPVSSGFEEKANMKMNMSLTPQDIAAPILKALGRQTTVLPAFLTKMLVYSLRTVPRWAKVQIMAKVMGGMTAHQRT